MGKLWIYLIIALVLVAGVVAYISFNNGDGSGNVLKSFEGEIREFDIIAKQFSFEPSVIEVNEGDLVKIRIRSVDVAHSIAIPDFRISERLNPDEEVEFEFVADKVGEFNFFCNVYCGEGHSEMGGKLVVR